MAAWIALYALQANAKPDGEVHGSDIRSPPAMPRPGYLSSPWYRHLYHGSASLTGLDVQRAAAHHLKPLANVGQGRVRVVGDGEVEDGDVVFHDDLAANVCVPRPDADAQRDGFGAHTVGGEETARGLCADDFAVLDYGDNYVYPGFPEAHCHPGGARALWHRPNVRREVGAWRLRTRGTCPTTPCRTAGCRCRRLQALL